ncbi:hypothetical protein D3878_07775 [Noviherbaspirillum sedimenti]|uniref:Uncharacterized protein n=1 Tax=Noviherbaspirillum sedimenti TaxID=2320865 RepID=A0A3A3FZB0_9BURK|nr:hypothetical protein D3878_07775 [Noviherbaspirillum sedimenti]
MGDVSGATGIVAGAGVAGTGAGLGVTGAGVGIGASVGAGVGTTTCRRGCSTAQPASIAHRMLIASGLL